MSFLLLKSGTVYDPANGIDGRVHDLWVKDGKIVARPKEAQEADQVLDLSGLIVMPGGVDVHSHIVGLGLNHARLYYPSAKLPLPSTTGHLYAGLGYTTVLDAAITPLAARHAHFDFAATPIIDKAFLLLVANHRYVLELIRQKRREELYGFLAWLLQATRGFGVKLVNPGGTEHWQQAHADIADIDAPVARFGVTSRQIILELSVAAESLGLPHPAHIHCNHLGVPGNWETTAATMKALSGRRAHLAHIQFHSYGGSPADPMSIESRAPDLVELFNQQSDLTADVGQIQFGPAFGLSADTPLAHYLWRVTGARLSTSSFEMEAGCGCLPLSYRKNKFVHSLQWAIGLEWLLLIKDPWRIALSTDHPNGASFEAYPNVIHLLMDKDYRQAVWQELHPLARERSVLGQLEREYTLQEIATITRAAPSRILGLANKGHLGPGADADIAVYAPSSDRQEMFSLPRYVFKSGEMIVEREEPRGNVCGTLFHVEPHFDSHMLAPWREWQRRFGTVAPDRYAIADEELKGMRAPVRLAVKSS
jgi:formylmethanofuran dehydrogenase subunit A